MKKNFLAHGLWGYFLLFVLFFTSATTGLLTATANARTKKRKQRKKKLARTLRFSVVGDIMMHKAQMNTTWNKHCRCYRFYPMFRPVRRAIRWGDIAIGNLETTLPGPKVGYTGYPRFGSPDSLAKALKKTGFNVLFTANNHSADRDKIGVVRTVKVLKKYKLNPVGTYRTLQEHKKNPFLLIRKKGFRIAILNYTEHTNERPTPDGTVINRIDKEKIRHDIALAKKQKPDLIVVGLHFGKEYELKPNDDQKKIVQETLASGADVILGAHTHVLQPYEIIRVKDRFGEMKPRLVIYSLGNFVSYQRKRYTRGGIVFQFRIRRSRKSKGISYDMVRFVPIYVHLGRGRPREVNKGGKRIKKKGRLFFRVLPIRRYWKNNRSLRLPTRAHRMMKLFYRDSHSLLKESKQKLLYFMKRKKRQ